MITERIDMREWDPISSEEGRRSASLCFQLNQTDPTSHAHDVLVRELFCRNVGEGCQFQMPLRCMRGDHVRIGNRVILSYNVLLMSIGQITIEDDVMIGANVSILAHNHDPYDRQIVTCEPVTIKKGAWIGATSTILPGVTVGKYAIVGAGAVVNRDVPDYAVVTGIPAKVVKMLDKEKIQEA